MWRGRKKDQVIVWVSQDAFHVFSVEPVRARDVRGFRHRTSFPFSPQGAQAPVEAFFPEEAFQGGEGAVVVVPDAWVSDKWVPFESTKTRLIESYAYRQVRRELGGDSEGAHFFCWRSDPSGNGRKGFHVRFARDPMVWRVFQALKRRGVHVRAITTAGFLWEDLLRNTPTVPKDEVKAVLFERQGRFHLYAFSDDRLAFHRDLKPMGTDPPSLVEVLSYEIQQSNVFFQQQQKRPFSRILLDGDGEWVSLLVENLKQSPAWTVERWQPSAEVKVWSDAADWDAAGWQRALALVDCDRVNALSGNILPSRHKRELALDPWFRWGILTGAATTAFILLGSLFSPTGGIWREVPAAQGMADNLQMPHPALNQWRQEAQFISSRFGKGSPALLLHAIQRSLPAPVTLEAVSMDLGAVTRLALDAVVTASSVHVFEEQLRMVLDGLGALDPNLKKIPLSRIPFEQLGSAKEGVPQRYRFHLELEIPWAKGA
ncbi:hypothetical protein SAMN02746041_00609 [Desulfacinum hydrothermale DSM 13146]|uniref:Uncharacterized protein n=1 Tax=Desulfacinum hydrothermale DSM 13146 TaxID=1121390 RepID=A0A1W1X575_9BACT|nr:hypothetical protein [Desulfacinum hydrothermale]SMC19056.1 hypothetical protein SAMN02746041_00609 [Desulfacinum hydrothermale DSM 13146]